MTNHQQKENSHPNRWIALCAICLLVVLLLLIGLLSKKQYLVISAADSGEVLSWQAVSNGETFSICFTHSVNKSPVTEIYLIEDDHIMLSASRFTAFGAGMQVAAEEGQTFSSKDGIMEISGYDTLITDLHYSVGHNTNHTLQLQGETIPLASLAEPGSTLSFSLQEVSWLLVRLNILPF